MEDEQLTAHEFLYALRRRWYVLVLGCLATAGLYLSATSSPDVYASRVSLLLLSPQPPAQPDTPNNVLQQPSPVGIAAVAVMQANGTPLRVMASSPDIPLYGQGVTDGSAITMRSVGNQWSPSAPVPLITIEAVGSSADVVAARIEADASRVRASIRSIENLLGVRPADRVLVTQSPSHPAVAAIPKSNTRALLGSGLIGIGLTAWAVASLELWLRRRRGSTTHDSRVPQKVLPPQSWSP